MLRRRRKGKRENQFIKSQRGALNNVDLDTFLSDFAYRNARIRYSSNTEKSLSMESM
jgi:hypothetical protein